MRSMKLRSAALAAFSLLLLAVVAIKSVPRKQEAQLSSQQLAELEEKDRRKTITHPERARLAKAKGQKKVVVSGVISLYMEASSPEELNQRLHEYTLVAAELVGQKSDIDEYDTLRTWSKFKVIDYISQAPPLSFLAPPTAPIPEELLPLREDEFLVLRPGGTVTIDGVDIVQHELGVPEFKGSQRYLLLLSLEPTMKIGEIVLGHQSILPINSDNSLDVKRSDHVLHQLMVLHHGGSSERLKQSLK